jgi:hypothetical protein
MLLENEGETGSIILPIGRMPRRKINYHNNKWDIWDNRKEGNEMISLTAHLYKTYMQEGEVAS